MSIAELCVGDTVFINGRSGSDTPSAMGGSGKVWAVDAGTAIDCRRDTPSATEITKYNARGERLMHQFFFPGSVDLDAVRSNATAHRLHWVSTRNGTVIDRYIRILDCYLEDSPDDDSEMELWIIDGTEETTRSDDAEATA